MKTNYHTHHYLCGHAEGDAWDYVSEAIKNDFKAIGISDHAPNILINDTGVRMRPENLNTYLADIDSAKRRAGDQIEVLAGLEVEYFPDIEEYYEDLKEKTDYLIHGQHYISMDGGFNDLISGFALGTEEQLIKYGEFLQAAIKSGHFLMLAHPDLYLCGYKKWDAVAERVAHMICEAAKEHDMILEYNANGFRKELQETADGLKRPYPRNEFWLVVKSYGIRTVLNSDCHLPTQLYDDSIKKAELEYQKLALNHIDFAH